MLQLSESLEDMDQHSMRVCNHCHKSKSLVHFINKRKTGICALCDTCRISQEIRSDRDVRNRRSKKNTRKTKKVGSKKQQHSAEKQKKVISLSTPIPIVISNKVKQPYVYTVDKEPPFLFVVPFSKWVVETRLSDTVIKAKLVYHRFSRND